MQRARLAELEQLVQLARLVELEQLVRLVELVGLVLEGLLAVEEIVLPEP